MEFHGPAVAIMTVNECTCATSCTAVKLGRTILIVFRPMCIAAGFLPGDRLVLNGLHVPFTTVTLEVPPLRLINASILLHKLDHGRAGDCTCATSCTAVKL